jgi:tetratricopeptide (TPR) repeat protein
MSEMLGNQYFLSRQFDKARQHFAEVLAKEPDNERVQKKQVICYCETGHVKDALILFDRITEENIALIADTDVVNEDCPCPEIVERMRWYEHVAANSFDFHCIMGMLNLYCNLNDSLTSFAKALKINPDHEQIRKIHERIKTLKKENVPVVHEK